MDGDGRELPEDAILGHLQAAAREMIQAARSMLDVFERAVEDPVRVLGELRREAPREREAPLERIEVVDEEETAADRDAGGGDAAGVRSG